MGWNWEAGEKVGSKFMMSLGNGEGVHVNKIGKILIRVEQNGKIVRF